MELTDITGTPMIATGVTVTNMLGYYEDRLLGCIIGLILGLITGIVSASVMADHKLKILMTGPKETIEEVRSSWLHLEQLEVDTKNTRENLGNSLKKAGY